VGHGDSYSNKSYRGQLPLEQLQKLADLAREAPEQAEVTAVGKSWLVRRRLNDDLIAEIVSKYRSGIGTPQLCLDYGISKPSMLDLLHARNVQMRRQPLTPKQRTEAVELYASGLAIKPVADRLGSSFGAVHRVLIAEGVKLRPRPGR
jgi:DNA-directed RNA polymerase specialized sigma24 family protein